MRAPVKEHRLEELRTTLRDVEIWGREWEELQRRLVVAVTALARDQHESDGARRRHARAGAQDLLDASKSASEATADAVRQIFDAGVAMLEECEREGNVGEAEPITIGTGGRLWQLVMAHLNDDRDTILFGMRSGLGLGLGVGAGCAAGWSLLLPLHMLIFATTVCSLMTGLIFGPMASAAFGRRADVIIGRLCVAIFLCSGAVICWSRIFRPATVESFLEAIVDITQPVRHSGTGQTIGLPRWGCVTTNVAVAHRDQHPATASLPWATSDSRAVCAAFYSCALLELRKATGKANADAESVAAARSTTAAAAQRHNRLVDALRYRTVGPAATLLLLLRLNVSNDSLWSSPRLPPVFSTVSVCGRHFVGVEDRLWWPVPAAPAPTEATTKQAEDQLLNGFEYRKGRVVHQSLLWQRGVLNWLASMLVLRLN